jgi:hypothetical protein
MQTGSPGPLATVRDLLAQAESDGTTPADAEALTAKAASLLAQHGLDRARLAAVGLQDDPLADLTVDLDNPWATAQAYLLTQLAEAMRCEAIETGRPGPGTRLHLFGYEADLDRAQILFASLRAQMTVALASQEVPATATSVRAWRRSWLLGWATAAIARVKTAEARAENAEADDIELALVLRDRVHAVRQRADAAYPDTQPTRQTFTGTGYDMGYSHGHEPGF